MYGILFDQIRNSFPKEGNEICSGFLKFLFATLSPARFDLFSQIWLFLEWHAYKRGIPCTLSPPRPSFLINHHRASP